MTETLWKIGNTYYRMECDLNLYKVPSPGLGLTPRRLRKVVERIPAGTGIYQKHQQRYPIPKEYRQQWEDETPQERAERDAKLNGYIDQTANLIHQKHGVIVSGSQETPAWLTKNGHAEFLNHIHEMLDNAKNLGVDTFHTQHKRNWDEYSPHYGKVSRLRSPKPLTVTFRPNPHPEAPNHAIAHYDDTTHVIHLGNPGLGQLDSFADYERGMLTKNQKASIHPNDYARYRHRGYWSLPEATFSHELGHALHNTRTKALGHHWDANQHGEWSEWEPHEIKTIKKHLSRYGADNGGEFVAEVTSRLLHGQPVNEHAMKLYHLVEGYPFQTDKIPEPVWRY